MTLTDNYFPCYFFPLRKPNKTGYMPFCGFMSMPLDPKQMVLFKKGKKFHYKGQIYAGNLFYNIYDFTITLGTKHLCRLTESDFKTYFLTKEQLRNKKIQEILEW